MTRYGMKISGGRKTLNEAKNIFRLVKMRVDKRLFTHHLLNLKVKRLDSYFNAPLTIKDDI